MARILAIAGGSTAALLPLAATMSGSSGVGSLALALGVATGLGVGLHEAGHVASLRGIPSALVTRGRRTYVLHAAVGPARRSLVAFAGPALSATTGLALVVVGASGAEPAIVCLGLPFAAHALSLTVIAGDGRAACGL